MFQKTKTVKQFSNERITFNELVHLIKQNPNKSKIQKLRSIDKSVDRKTYDRIKLTLPCIIPSGIFNSLSNQGLQKLSGYLYFDIDNFDTINELNDTIRRLNDTFPISLITKSAGGMGISFLIKVLDIEKYDFNSLQDYIFDKISREGFKLDKKAKGLCRKMVISSDNDVIVNFDTFFEVNDTLLDQFKSSSKIKIGGGQLGGRKEINNYELNDTFINENDTIEIIPITQLKNQIKFESKYEENIDGDYIVEDMNYHYIISPKEIKDGSKHRIYTRIIHGLYYLNPDISRIQILSYLYWLNKSAEPPMLKNKLINLLNFVCDSIETSGEIIVKTRTKRVHFNKESNLTKKDKQKIAQNIMAKKKVQNTIRIINLGKEYYMKLGMPFTQKMISEHTGLSIATIKRHWTKEYMEEEIKPARIEMVDKLEVIEEEEFFNEKPKQKILYKGFKEIEIEIITKEDIETFLKQINKLEKEWFGVSEELLVEVCPFQPEKTLYLYEKYLKKVSLLNNLE